MRGSSQSCIRIHANREGFVTLRRHAIHCRLPPCSLAVSARCGVPSSTNASCWHCISSRTRCLASSSTTWRTKGRSRGPKIDGKFDFIDMPEFYGDCTVMDQCSGVAVYDIGFCTMYVCNPISRHLSNKQLPRADCSSFSRSGVSSRTWCGASSSTTKTMASRISSSWRPRNSPAWRLWRNGGWWGPEKDGGENFDLCQLYGLND